MTVSIAQTDKEIRACWPVMAQLRTHLTETDFVRALRRQSREAYRLAFISRGPTVAAVAGFRILHNLAWGRFCYVDDLVTDEAARSQGLGERLLDWLCAHARGARCQRLELDSGVQRHGAHRFYLHHRMFISCYHFSMDLTAPAVAGMTHASRFPSGPPAAASGWPRRARVAGRPSRIRDTTRRRRAG
jgi:GNAT superfamily N-acetyltransferase